MKTNTYNIILLIIRIIVGGFIAWAGYAKLIDMDTTVSAFNQDFGISATITWIVAIGELLAGLGVLFGVWTRVASAAVIILMIGAVYYTGGTELYSWLILIGSIFLIIVGGGDWSLIPDRKLYNKDMNMSNMGSRDAPRM